MVTENTLRKFVYAYTYKLVQFIRLFVHTRDITRTIVLVNYYRIEVVNVGLAVVL